jgi:hypothetical protein
MLRQVLAAQQAREQREVVPAEHRHDTATGVGEIHLMRGCVGGAISPARTSASKNIREAIG